MSLCVSYLHSWRDVKQSTDSHWNRPWTVSQSQYIQCQSECWPIWGPKMAHKFDLLLHTYNSSSNDLIHKVSSESSGNFCRKLLAEDSRKSRINLTGGCGCGHPKKTWTEVISMDCLALGLTVSHSSNKKSLSGRLEVLSAWYHPYTRD